jgi:hypothetical protein
VNEAAAAEPRRRSTPARFPSAVRAECTHGARAGNLQLAAVWPAGLPSGLSIALQAWIVDAAAPKGFSASNGLLAVPP